MDLWSGLRFRPLFVINFQSVNFQTVIIMVEILVRTSLTITFFTLSASEILDMENLNWCFIKSPLEQNIIENFLGDGHCDDALNIPECDHDLGDCCLQTLNRDGFGQ